MEKPVLFINACVRKESRTLRLAESLLMKLGEPFEEICLKDVRFPVVDEDFLKRRDELIARGEPDNPIFDISRQFTQAEIIVIAAPYWDLSFPSTLKQYFEQVSAVGVSFTYTPEGFPAGLCRAKKLYYVTTAGGTAYIPEEFGFGYVKALAQKYYGIQDVRLIKAEGLDIVGADPEAILRAAEDSMSV